MIRTELTKQLKQLAGESFRSGHGRGGWTLQAREAMRFAVMEIEDSQKENERLRAALNDCVALITGQASGEAQREGIIRESIAILGKHYAGPVVSSKRARRCCAAKVY